MELLPMNLFIVGLFSKIPPNGKKMMWQITILYSQLVTVCFKLKRWVNNFKKLRLAFIIYYYKAQSYLLSPKYYLFIYLFIYNKEG